jgi:ribosomal protein L20
MNDRSKKQEEVSRAAAIRQAFMDRERATGTARSTLAQLEGWLSDHEKEFKVAEQRCCRLPQTVRRVVANGTVLCLAEDVNLLATQLIGGKDLGTILLAQEKSPILDRFYRSINFTGSTPDLVDDPEDLEVFKAWNRERAALEILKSAIRLQRKAMSAINTTSMEKFSRTVVQARAATARQVLAALGELRRIVVPDQDLATGLDEDEVAALRPRPFPTRILSSDAMSWMMDAVAVGMIEATELIDLPEIVSPAPEAMLT